MSTRGVVGFAIDGGGGGAGCTLYFTMACRTIFLSAALLVGELADAVPDGLDMSCRARASEGGSTFSRRVDWYLEVWQGGVSDIPLPCCGGSVGPTVLCNAPSLLDSFVPREHSPPPGWAAHLL